MTKIEDIINQIQKIAPLETQESWDNSGWQIRLQKKDIKKIMLCVSITKDVLKQTLAQNCDMIISHHPLFFDGAKEENLLSVEIIKEHLPVYSIHTPFDKAKNGTTDIMIKTCGFCVDEVLNEYTKIYYADITMQELIHRIKRGLGIKKLRITNYNPEKIVKKVAFCAGSGTSFCNEVKAADCDCFITADLKYHTAMDFEGTIIDVGHLESERPSLQTIKDTFKNIECIIAQENSPIEIL